MTLKEMLSTLKTKNVLATVTDKEDNEICKIYSEGVDSLDDTIEERKISKWNITGATSLSIILDNAETTDPSDP